MSVRPYARLDGPDGAPVLVLGGSLGTTHAMWEPQAGPLAERFRIIRYDHAGHGASAPPEPPYTIGTLATGVLRLLDELGVRRASYAGLSLGGMVGMWLAAHAPDRIDRLALLCTSALLGPAEGWRQRAAAVRAGGMGAVADAVVARWFTPGLAASRPETVAAYRAMLLATSAPGYAACCEAIGAMDLRPELALVRAPTLVIAGARDPATPVAHARAIVEGIAGARLRIVEDAAHLANVERPGTVTRLLREHFGREAAGGT